MGLGSERDLLRDLGWWLRLDSSGGNRRTNSGRENLEPLLGSGSGSTAESSQDSPSLRGNSQFSSSVNFQMVMELTK